MLQIIKEVYISVEVSSLEKRNFYNRELLREIPIIFDGYEELVRKSHINFNNFENLCILKIFFRLFV